MSNEYGYGVVDCNGDRVLSPITTDVLAFDFLKDASAYASICNATSNLNGYKNTPWRVVKLTWSDIDE